MRKLLTFALFSTVTMPTFAVNNTVFSCTTANGEYIQVNKTATNYDFTYGKTRFKTPLKQVLSNRVVGSHFMTTSLSFNKLNKNFTTTYRLEITQPSGANKSPAESATLSILSNQKTTTVECDSTKNITANLDN